MQNNFTVALGQELMAARFQIRAQFLLIVNLAVRDEPKRLFRVAQWLVAARKIDDRQPPLSDRRAIIDIAAYIIRSSMCKGAQQAVHRRRMPLYRPHHASDATHSLIVPIEFAAANEGDVSGSFWPYAIFSCTSIVRRQWSPKITLIRLAHPSSAHALH
jgi:hypothetical protein